MSLLCELLVEAACTHLDRHGLRILVLPIPSVYPIERGHKRAAITRSSFILPVAGELPGRRTRLLSMHVEIYRPAAGCPAIHKLLSGLHRSFDFGAFTRRKNNRQLVCTVWLQAHSHGRR